MLAHRRRGPAWLLPVLLAGCCTLRLSAQQPPTTATALDRYVAAPDPSYAFRLVRTATAAGNVTVHFLELTSQTWLTTAEVDRPVWKHSLILYVPPAPISLHFSR